MISLFFSALLSKVLGEKDKDHAVVGRNRWTIIVKETKPLQTSDVELTNEPLKISFMSLVPNSYSIISN